MKKLIKHIFFDKLRMYFLKDCFNEIFRIRGKGNKVIKKGRYCSAKIYIVGNGNTIIFKKGSFVDKIPIRVVGNNCYIEIGENVSIYNRLQWCDILCEGNGNQIVIGDNTSIQSAHINAQEDGSKILIGKDCMLSECIIVRTSDSHPIYDLNSYKRINFAKDVIIGDHCWIAARACILKGTVLKNNVILGVGSIVTHEIPTNSIAVGIPAIVKRENIIWDKKFTDQNESKVINNNSNI